MRKQFNLTSNFTSLLLTIIMMNLPLTVGSAEADKKGEAKPAEEAKAAAEGKTDAKAEAGKEGEAVAEAPAKHVNSECLASEEIIKDLETRENALKQRETTFAEKEKELDAQKNALKEEMAKLEVVRAEIQGIRGKELSDREEKVNKLVETFESMSPKAAAGVISKIDEELATTALSRLSTVKAGKILSAMDSTKSSRLSEMIAFGSAKVKRKEKESGESAQRAPANSR